MSGMSVEQISALAGLSEAQIKGLTNETQS